MSREVSDILVIVQGQVPDRVVYLGRAVDGRVLGVCEVYQIDSVLLAVDRDHLRALLAVVDHDLVIFAARDERLSAGRVVDAVDSVGVLSEYFGDLETLNDRFDELHFLL